MYDIISISIPYRSYSNNHTIRDVRGRQQISIPYRSYSNLLLPIAHKRGFLISIPYRSYSNEGFYVLGHYAHEFQSLIGLILTSFMFYSGLAFKEISIPYRSYSNLLIPPVSSTEAHISIPYRSYSNHAGD